MRCAGIADRQRWLLACESDISRRGPVYGKMPMTFAQSGDRDSSVTSWVDGDYRVAAGDIGPTARYGIPSAPSPIQSLGERERPGRSATASVAITTHPRGVVRSSAAQFPATDRRKASPADKMARTGESGRPQKPRQTEPDLPSPIAASAQPCTHELKLPPTPEDRHDRQKTISNFASSFAVPSPGSPLSRARN